MSALTFLVVFSLVFLINNNNVIGESSLENTPSVELPLGRVEGNVRKSLSGNKFFAFEGVPYASPPIGKHKFKQAVPPKPWPGTLKANTIHKCLQYNHLSPPGQDKIVGEEDCLYLNIYTPNLSQKANLDVIVYIHGGCFMFNYGGMQGPEYLLDKQLVYVSLNYRLGPLGFLSTENEILPGNVGIKDQILALKWVQDNIAFFGGNAKSVTIIGMSAGGASVHLHYLSPQSKDLFHKGFSQSGTALNPWVLVENPLEKTQKLAELVGCSKTSLRESVDCLARRPGRQLVAAVKEFQPWLYNPFSPFGVVVDAWAADPVLPEHPYTLLKSGKFNDKPWISSYTDSEGLYPGAEFYDNHLQEITERWNDLLPIILDYNNTVPPGLLTQTSEKIKNFYIKSPASQKISKSNFQDFLRILSDRIFIRDIEKTIRLQAAASKSDVFVYYFTHRGASSWSERFVAEKGVDLGASHADDTGYLFKMSLDTTSTSEDREIVKFFVELVENFAREGKPQSGLGWSPADKKKSEVITRLIIGKGGKKEVEKGNCGCEQFWDSLPILENEKLVGDGPGKKKKNNEKVEL